MNRHVPTRPDGTPDWLGMAIDLARDNVAAGGWPFGAVIVRDGVLLAAAANDVLGAKDPTAHAELRAIRDACAVVGDIRLSGAVLYSSCEPCPMCMAATLWVDLKSVVYGADSGAAARAGFEDQEIAKVLSRPRDTWQMTVIQQGHHLAEGPLRAWAQSQPEESRSF